MNADNVRKWVEALRSGDYVQTEGTLCRRYDAEARYCCLGVVCDLAALDGVEMQRRERAGGDNTTVISFDGISGTLPQVARDWLAGDGELPYGNPTFTWDKMQVKDPEAGEGSEITATGCNDDAHLSFDQIADMVEWAFLSGEGVSA